jgi:hypothetical protein
MARRRNNGDDQVKPKSKTLKVKNTNYKEASYTDDLNPFDNEPKSVAELLYFLEKNGAELDATVYKYDKKTKQAIPFKMDKKAFTEAYKKNSTVSTFRESIDSFSTDLQSNGSGGQDFIPLLGGPFNRQQYLGDMLKGQQQAFFASTHDPILRTAVDIIVDFVLGRGFRADCTNKKKLALWESFAEVNEIQEFARNYLRELIIYGEQFVHWLPDNQIFNQWQVPEDQISPTGMLPRVRLLDPSTVWEIVTFPEDIKRQLYLQLVYSTQYQIYTGSENGRPVPSTKYIYRQIPVGQYKHYKINNVYNEKRGRSDLFPVLAYAKRLRDSVNYSILGLQKSTAWAIDTTIDGNQTDIDNYIDSQEALGEMPPPGSEFVHSTKVTRTYLSNEGASKAGNSQAFEWCFSMICAGLGIPMQYFGIHLSGGGTRGNAIVATEPVAKKFEYRQKMVETMLKDLSIELFKKFGLEKEVGDIEFTFPEIVSQDRTAKLKDLALAEQMEWISHDRAMSIAAKELNVTEFDPELEKGDIENDKAQGFQQDLAQQKPLTSPGLVQQNNIEPNASITSKDKSDLRKSRGF